MQKRKNPFPLSGKGFFVRQEGDYSNRFMEDVRLLHEFAVLVAGVISLLGESRGGRIRTYRPPVVEG